MTSSSVNTKNGLSSSRDYSICCYCHNTATTKDHVPPKNIFPRPRPTNLITVPSCKTCNEDPSLDDEYFGLIIAAGSAGHPQASELFRGKVKKKTKSHPALAKLLLDNISKKDIYSGNIYIGTQYELKIEGKRFNPIMIRITKGLYWYHFRKPLPVNHKINVSKVPPEISRTQKDMINTLDNYSIGDDVFQYRFYRDPNNSLLTYWFFLFFKSLFIMTTSDLELFDE